MDAHARIVLAEERERAISSMRELSQLYTKQSDDPDAPKLSKYLLRGVSATKDVTYICRRPEPDLIEMDLDDGEPKEKGDQWWRIAYVSEGYNARTVVSVGINHLFSQAKLTISRKPPRKPFLKLRRTRAPVSCLCTLAKKP